MISGAGIFNTVILVGAIQGFVITLLLFFSGKNNPLTNRLLAALIFLISLACLSTYLMESGVRYSSRAWEIIAYTVPFIIVMPIGPLIYFYTRSSADPHFELTAKHCVHFYPVVLDLIPYVSGTLYLIGTALGAVTRSEGGQWISFIDTCHTYLDIPRWISLSSYVYLSWRVVKNLKPGNREHVNLKWIREFIYVFLGFQVIWFLYLVPYVVPSFRNTLLTSVSYYPLYIPLVVLVYWLGIKGYMDNPLVRSGKKDNPGPPLAEETVLQTEALLRKAMEKDRLFLNPSLSLNFMINHIHKPQKVISTVLNQHLNKSFNEFVNEYRINEVKKRLLEPGNEHLTITGIALECGFNSQATFQRTFKQCTRQSPREFLASHPVPSPSPKSSLKATQV